MVPSISLFMRHAGAIICGDFHSSFPYAPFVCVLRGGYAWSPSYISPPRTGTRAPASPAPQAPPAHQAHQEAAAAPRQVLQELT